MLLQQSGFKLLKLMEDEGFAGGERHYSTPPPPDPKTLAAMGPAGPVEMPTKQVPF
jgi:hypothetical protein